MGWICTWNSSEGRGKERGEGRGGEGRGGKKCKVGSRKVNMAPDVEKG